MVLGRELREGVQPVSWGAATLERERAEQERLDRVAQTLDESDGTGEK
ncbi:hypothetical protein [Streptomyces melanogenes]|uniref:Uncharacterized protein n=1 Tax=Streptomyces melanogenes TaxID=67326 RepID=A0ABZ1XWU4_9ACTN|nr:hypothetical protein [Streptomyces melanogenes]